MVETDLLALHADLSRVAQALPKSGRLSDCVRKLRRTTAQLALLDADRLVATTDPVSAFAQAVDLAIAAGASWQDLAVTLNRASDRRTL